VPLKLCLVTSVDDQMFDQLLLLGESLRRSSSGLTLNVCDFGLTPAQRAYVRGRYTLLDMPPGIAARHPWDCKSQLDTPLRWTGMPWSGSTPA
jgi:hypothetical protein